MTRSTVEGRGRKDFKSQTVLYSGYLRLFRKHRQGRQGGGVALSCQ